LSPPRQAEINNLIFAPGFSTALEVTSISGRGVGMDIVRSNIEQIGGTVDVVSAPGSGTSFVIKIPLTLAIVAALIVEIAGERFAFPQLAVLELVRLNGEHRIEWIKSAPLLRLRQRLLPLIDVKKSLSWGLAMARMGSSLSFKRAVRFSELLSTMSFTPRGSSSSRCRRSTANCLCCLPGKRQHTVKTLDWRPLPRKP